MFIFVFRYGVCSCSCVCVRLNKCCVHIPVRAEHMLVFGQRCLLQALGKTILNPKFFGDIGVVNPDHQLLFCKGVSKSAFSPLPREEQASRPDMEST